MSIKQNQHNEHYHITNEDDYKNVEIVDDDIEEISCQLEQSVVDDANEIIATLETITAELRDVNPSLIQEAVNQFLTPDDKKEMVDLYMKCFDELPNDNDIKLYVLQMFNQLCIPITRMPEIE
tara:strand:- start:5554 stop:5922 length:369 start_codon:yes stop_codon:yes gene_type:complete